MLPVVIILAFACAIVAFCWARQERSIFLAFGGCACLALAILWTLDSFDPIRVTNTVTPGTVIKTPNAVIAEIRVGDRIERAIFTDIPTYQHATPQTRIIWRETETSWGKTGVIVLDL